MNSCVICTKHHQQDHPLYIHSLNHFKLYHAPIESQVLGYIYLEPIRHIEHWHQLTHEELTEMTDTIQKIELLMQKEVQAERLYVVTISEAVRHLHLHLIPRSNSSSIRGIDLIHQATQQVVQTPSEEFTMSSLKSLISKLHDYFSS